MPRTRFIITPAQLLAVGSLCLTMLLGPSSIGGESSYDLSSTHNLGPTTQTLSIEYEMGGELLTPTKDERSEQNRLAVKATAKLAYDEVCLATDATRCVRHYRMVQADTTVGNRQKNRQLRDSRRLIVAQASSAGVRFTGVEGLLYRDEADLLEVPGDSLALEGLLPKTPVSLGDTWQHDAKEMGLMAGIDSVGLCEVSSVLAEANDQYARCQLAGVLHGVVHGSSVELELNGIYLVDLTRRHVSQFHLAVREQRAIGPATPGLHAVTKVRIRRTDTSDNSPLTEAVVARTLNGSLDNPQAVEMRSDSLGFWTSVDTSWYPISEHGKRMTIRRVTSNGLVAHGNLARLEPKSLDPANAPATFRSDFFSSIGTKDAQLVTEQQWVNQSGCRVMSIVAAGRVAGQDVEWHAYQVAPPAEYEHLHRVAITFTVERDQLRTLGHSDRTFVDHMHLVPNNQSLSRRPMMQK